MGEEMIPALEFYGVSCCVAIRSSFRTIGRKEKWMGILCFFKRKTIIFAARLAR